MVPLWLTQGLRLTLKLKVKGHRKFINDTEAKRRVRFARIMAQKTRIREYLCLLGVRIVKCYGVGVKNTENPQILGRNRGFSMLNENHNYIENGNR